MKKSVFTGKKLKEASVLSGLSQDEAAKKMNMSRRSLNYIETGEREVTSDQIVDFAKLYNIDVREVLLESYVMESEEQLLCSRYASFLKLFDQLSDKDKEDVIWVIRQRVSGSL
ncbi:MAG: helix-turn-helix domain-containing protein [Lachnospiraceae bacterium]|nr:helix-turn-helix domain-containing protein [Lachnospiraceae bacterium]